MRSVLHDVRYGLRLLWKSPSFALVAIGSIALGISAATVIFSAVNGVLLRPLRFQNPEQLVAIWGSIKDANLAKNWISEPEYWDFKRDLHSFSGVAAVSTGGGLNLSAGSGEPLRVSAAGCTANFFPLLGISPQMGRAFAPGEDEPGRDAEVLLSYSLWKNRFGSDPQIIGKTIILNARSYSIIGVLPPGFQYQEKHDVWVPMALNRAKPEDRGSHYLQVVGRLAPGVTVEQAGSELAREADQLAERYPDNYSRGNFGLHVYPLKADFVGDVRTPLLVLLAAVACLLLIAIANVASLLLARASQREKEIAIRVAMGAGRMRVIRQLITEGITLSLIGCLAGVAIAYKGVDALKFITSSVPRAEEIVLDGRVLLVSIVVSVFTGVLFASAPAFHLIRSTAHRGLKEGGRSNTAGRIHQRTRNALAATEIGLALVLLVGTGLLIRSFYRILDVEPGFKVSHLFTFHLTLPSEKYQPVQQTAFFRRVLDDISHMPGVQATGAVSELPLSGAYASGDVIGESATGNVPRLRNGLSYVEADRRIVTAGYFETLGVKLLQGRFFTSLDDDRAPMVVIVDDDFAARFWPGQNPLGKRVAFGGADNPQWREIVGVVKHVRHYGLDQHGREQAYVPLPQRPTQDMYIAVRTGLNPAALAGDMQKLVYQFDPAQPIYEAETMDELLDHSFSQRRFNMVLLGLFAGLALLMATIGVYGVISYGVALRTQEFGIRMALGAQRGDVLRLVLSQAGLVFAIGIVGGLAGAVLLSRALASLLFGISASDPVTFGAVSLLLCAVALGASYLPARRATKVDPMVALRYE